MLEMVKAIIDDKSDETDRSWKEIWRNSAAGIVGSINAGKAGNAV